MKITKERIALLNTLPFIYLRRDAYAPVELVKNVILFGDDICIQLEGGNTLQVTHEWQNEEWYIHDLSASCRYILRLPEGIRVIFCAYKLLTPELSARHRLAGLL
jgi:hypothetical protein